MSSRRRGALRLALTLCFAALLSLFCFQPCVTPSTATAPFRVTFIDVGQGDSAWLNTPDGWDILIDGGRESEGPGLVSYLQSQGVSDIEVLVLTHPHADHVGGLVEVVENLEVDQALTNCQPYSTDIYQDFLDLLVSEGIPIVCVQDGDTFAWGAYVSGVTLHPPDPLMSGTGSDANNNSIVLLVTYGTIDFLFTGDIESEAEVAILSGGPAPDAEILKVAHHGSNTSSTASFLAAVGAQDAMVSVGIDNRFAHPSPLVLERVRATGAAVHRTDLQGNLVVQTDGNTYTVSPERYVQIQMPVAFQAWPTPLPEVRVDPVCSQFDAPGSDNHNLNQEYVCFTNCGGSPQLITEWHVKDESGHTFTFPSFALNAGASVVLHTGSGADSSADLYWGRAGAVWNNAGDRAYLYDATWSLVDTYSY